MQVWEEFLSQIREEIGSGAFERWLAPLKLLRFDAANIYLEAKDSFQISWFEEHIRPRIKKKLFNNNQRLIAVHLSLPSGGEGEKKPVAEYPRLNIKPDALDPEMTLEHFIPLEQNLMAFKLISEISATTPFNPIYLYGPKGSGKTHLLMGAAHRLKSLGKKVFFAKAETFTEHVVQAIRLGFMQDFRKAYRDIDVLLIDDIHIFSKKSATQEEFFHTFNALHTFGKPILLSANAAPSSLSEIEPRLISRFEWGLSLSLDKPDIRPILEKKSSLWNLPLSPDLAQFLLSRFKKNPLQALQALALRSKGAPPTPLIAEKLLRDLLEEENRHILTHDEIIKLVAAHYGVKTEDLLGDSKMREYALPRQVAMYYCREKLKMPFQKIGELFKRDHSTVMTSVKQIQKAIEENKIELISIG